MEKKYIGIKIIGAEQSVKIGGKVYLETDPVPHNLEKREEGYTAIDGDGNVSWVPKYVFEKAYRRIDDMTFGLAIEAAKQGRKIARRGWNDKGMFVVFQKGYPQGIPCNEQTMIAWELKVGDLFKCNPYLQIKQGDGSHSMWVPSIDDVLAEDWRIV